MDNTRNTTQKLLVCEKPLKHDKICYQRKLEKNLKYQAKHLGARLILLQEDKTKKAIEEVLKKAFDDISDEDENLLFQEYLKRFIDNINHFLC